jgi:hypothetical protein
MLVQRGGHKVQSGTYWNLDNGERMEIAGEHILPGNNSVAYLRMPTIAVLTAGPVLGLLYALFLPFIGIVMTITLITGKLISRLFNVSLKSTGFGWRPVESYLEGKQRQKKIHKGTSKDEKM